MPFTGTDIWNAWELTWLGPTGLPKAATARFEVPATSPALIESKSLKLYLGSFAMTRFATPADVANAIETDLSDQAGAPVAVSMNPDAAITAAEGRNIDALDVDCMSLEVDAGLLAADRDDPAEEILNPHLLRSLCPVTGQPDIGSHPFRTNAGATPRDRRLWRQ
ncbi:MAG: hypothetical protein P8X94_15395 [Woeseiaceae bacterium]